MLNKNCSSKRQVKDLAKFEDHALENNGNEMNDNGRVIDVINKLVVSLEHNSHDCSTECFIVDDEKLVNNNERNKIREKQGHRMPFNKMEYNLSKMWGNFGLKEVISNGSGMFYKFDNETGMNHVVECGPWLVKNKPLVVQRWIPEVNIEIIDPKCIPIWVKLVNVPLEA
nr:ATPase, F1/V1/A1 complex, alpha/beta subunit, zinc knuckle CX2CX4HX4C [Tanacetum cinerariifolium]